MRLKLPQMLLKQGRVDALLAGHETPKLFGRRDQLVAQAAERTSCRRLGGPEKGLGVVGIKMPHLKEAGLDTDALQEMVCLLRQSAEVVNERQGQHLRSVALHVDVVHPIGENHRARSLGGSQRWTGYAATVVGAASFG